ncbi:putative disease resistance protein RGA3, partial [Bienertia sinuspersici]
MADLGFFVIVEKLIEIIGSELIKQVRGFFSSEIKLGKAYWMSRRVKEIRKRLDAIADDHNKFKLDGCNITNIRKREDTCSHVVPSGIIGREKDKEAIKEMLLDHNNEEICCLTIVGIGGLGKTALAQLVYNDEKIKEEFRDLRLWVCVADQDGVQFDDKTILCKILEAATHQKYDDRYTKELVSHQFKEILGGRKYFLVLDDVWNEDRMKWDQLLKDFLMLGQRGSKVVVTTRSKSAGALMDEKYAYKLEGLTQEDSWNLFEMSAFDKGFELENRHEFVEIGKRIVDKCHSNPLALKVVGSLLNGQDIRKWQSFEDSGLAEIKNGDNDVLSILKFSYHNLTPSLKNCFSYCALFPKDYRIEKQMLIDLWIAQGYIIPLDGGQSIENAAEEHFLILLRRCFFQDIHKDDYGNIKFVKIHDLMHDIAQEVGREEICVVTCIPSTLGDKIRHVCYAGDSFLESTLGSSNLRSFICRGYGTCVMKVHTQIENHECLRVLELSDLNVVKLPDSIGKLQHLRYLNLSRNKNLDLLPNATTRLHNLQTLILRWCRNLKELPKDFCKLVKLRQLDLLHCEKLIYMPLGMEKLTSLQVLPYFVVGKRASKDDSCDALKYLTLVRGGICIKIGENYSKVEGRNDNNEGYLKSMKYLTKVQISFEVRCDDPEGVLETLEPTSNVKQLDICNYRGKRIPKWGRAMNNWAFSLCSLVKISLNGCRNLEEMPVLSKLPLLKTLSLIWLDKVEYMEENTSDKSDNQSAKLFFPSLDSLKLCGLEKLKGWWKEESTSYSPSSLNGVDDDNYYILKRRLRFSCLSKLEIEYCPNLTSFPSCSKIEQLKLIGTNKRLEIHVDIDSNTTGNSQDDFGLRELKIDNMGYLKSLPLNCLTELDILSNQKVDDRLSERGEVESHVLENWASSLKTLGIGSLKDVRRLCGEKGLQYFTALEHLTLRNDSSYLFDPEKEDEKYDKSTQGDAELDLPPRPHSSALCFFQDVCKTMYGDVESIKIHDLMHNVAQEAGREEICVVTYSPNTLGNKVRHLSYAGVGYFESTLGSSKIRSFICRGYGRCVVDMHTIENQMCLRVLELSNLGIEKLPNSIGKLQHLRYLNLSDNGLLGVLPNEITMLHNLQTLILASCYRLRELPKGFCRLVKLRHLDLLSCPNLICMPLGMEKLTSLEVLPYFMVGKTTLKDDDFEALKSLTRVRGRIWITIGENYGKEKAVDDNKGGYLKSMKHLNCVEINFARCCNNTEAVLKTLEPPSNVKELQIDSYKGKRIPWGTIVDNWAHTLSHLVMIKLCRCNYLEEIPVLRKLPLLKELNLQYLSNLEYMEINSDVSDTQSILLFFPSLVCLQIYNLENLKGWWKHDSSSSSSSSSSSTSPAIIAENCFGCLSRRLRFPCLSELTISDCPNLASFPSCPTIEQLELKNTNRRLEIHVDIDDINAGNSQDVFRLWELKINNMGYLKSLPINRLTNLEMSGDEGVDILLESGGMERCVLEKLASSLKRLEIDRMNRRRLLGEKGFQYFTALEDLTLSYIEEDNLEHCSFPQNLVSLRFNHVYKMESLPKGIQHSTALQHLSIVFCGKFKLLPEWISCLSSLKSLLIGHCRALKSLPQAMHQLTSLQRLYINHCPQLKERCKEPDGEDYPKIKHIPNI